MASPDRHIKRTHPVARDFFEAMFSIQSKQGMSQGMFIHDTIHSARTRKIER